MKKEEEATVVVGWEDQWKARIEPLAQAAGKTLEELNAALTKIVGPPSEAALGRLSDSTLARFHDLQTYLVDGIGVPISVLRQYEPVLRGTGGVQLPVVAGSGGMMAITSFTMLPVVQSDDMVTEVIKVGGVIKFKDPLAALLCANRAGVADLYGLFGLPEKLVEAMESMADKMNEPCPDEFYVVMDHIRRKKYSEILKSYGLKGIPITEKRRKELLGRVRGVLWPSIRGFHQVLIKFRQDCLTTLGENGLLALIAKSQGVAGSSGLADNIMVPPATDSIYDAVETLNEAFNKTFSGMRHPTAVALAGVATEIRAMLDEPSLPLALRLQNKDELLRMLGISATATDKTTEKALAIFTLGVLQLPDHKQKAGEYKFIGELTQLGSMIRWDDLLGKNPAPSSPPASSGGSRPRGSMKVDM